MWNDEIERAKRIEYVKMCTLNLPRHSTADANRQGTVPNRRWSARRADRLDAYRYGAQQKPQSIISLT